MNNLSKKSLDSTKILLSRLLKGSIKEEEVDLSIVLDEIDNGTVVVLDTNPMRVVGKITKFSNSVQFVGNIICSWSGVCSYGAIDIERELKIEFSEIFEKDFTFGQTYELRGDSIDIEQLIRDAVIPELPHFPVCQEGEETHTCQNCKDILTYAKDTKEDKGVWAELDKIKFD